MENKKFESINQGWMHYNQALEKFKTTKATMIRWRKTWPECFEEVTKHTIMVKYEELNSHVKRF